MSLPSFDGLNESVVDKDVLFLCLDQVVPLLPDVLQVAEDIDVPARLNLPEDGVHHNVAASAADSSAAKSKNQIRMLGINSKKSDPSLK